MNAAAMRKRNSRIAACYLAGNSLREAAAEFGLSKNGIRKVLIKESVDRRGGRSTFWDDAPENVETLVADWGSVPPAEIAERLGTTKAAVIGKAYRLDLPWPAPHALHWAGV